MDDEFIRRATDVELRLEAEGMTATADAIRQIYIGCVFPKANVLIQPTSTETAQDRTKERTASSMFCSPISGEKN